MKTMIVDASVAIKWFVPEIHAITALRLLDMPVRLMAPDLIFAETGNILWKKWRRKELSLPDAAAILEDFKQMPLDIAECEPLVEIAWQIATGYDRTFYDSLYLALAKSENGKMVTADRAFYNALHKEALGKSLLWIEDISKP